MTALLGRIYASTKQATRARESYGYAGADDLSPDLADLQATLSTGDPGAALLELETIIERHELDDAHAACITLGRLHLLDLRIARETAARIGLAWGRSRTSGRPTAVNRRHRPKPRHRGPRRVQARGSPTGDGADPIALGPFACVAKRTPHPRTVPRPGPILRPRSPFLALRLRPADYPGALLRPAHHWAVEPGRIVAGERIHEARLNRYFGV